MQIMAEPTQVAHNFISVLFFLCIKSVQLTRKTLLILAAEAFPLS